MKHLGTLRLSVLLALGLGPSACGGQASGSADSAGATSGTAGTGATSGTAGTGATSGTAGTGATTELCASPVVDATGLVSCEQGYRHRPKSQTCGSRSQAEEALPRAEDVDAVVRCVNDAGVVNDSACHQFAYGYCNAPESTICLSGCVTDKDCDPGYICACGSAQSPTGGVCTSAPSCAIDADCGEGSLCASYGNPCGGSGFLCLTDEDECRTASDCLTSSDCAVANGHRICVTCLN